MAAPTGNKFWLAASSIGRDKIFETPEKLWEASCEYFQYCLDNPLKKIEIKVINIGDYQSKAEKVEVDVMIPFTMHGLCRFLGVESSYFRSFKSQERINKEAFITVITRIEEVVFEQKFVGAASGFFNANIIARDLGLSDKKDLEVGNKGDNPFRWEIIDNESQSKD